MKSKLSVSAQTQSLDTDFARLALQLFAYQYERNRPYKQFCDLSSKTPKNILSWEEIPALPAAAFKDVTLTCFPAKKAVKVFKTSGTTLEKKGSHYLETLQFYEASIVPPFKKHLLFDKASLQYFFLTQSPASAPHSSLSHMMGVVNRQFAKGRGQFYVKGDQAFYRKLAADLSREKQKAFLLSTAFSLLGFLDFLKQSNQKLKLPKGSRLMETGGFKGRVAEVSKAKLYQDCHEWLGIPLSFCFSEYGMTELSSQLYSRGGGVFRAPAWLKTLAIDPRSGKVLPAGRVGALRHFDLANVGSVLAIQTEDMGRVTREGVELLGRAKLAELRGCSLDYERFLHR